MSRERRREQDQNTAKLVMNTFHRIAGKHGASAADITNYLQDKFGDVWKMSTLICKAEETLKKSAVLGFLERQGSRYVTSVSRGIVSRRACLRRPYTRKKPRKFFKKRTRLNS